MDEKNDELSLKIKEMRKMYQDKSISKADKYRKIRDIILSCKRDERSCLLITFKCGINTGERLNEYKGIVTLFISICAMLFSVAIPFLTRSIELVKEIGVQFVATAANASLQDVYSNSLDQYQDMFKNIMGMVLFIIILAIGIYTGLSVYSSRHIDEDTYLFEMVSKYI